MHSEAESREPDCALKMCVCLQGAWQAPTFFINGFKFTALDSTSDVEAWKRVIDPLITKGKY
jgi:hypothetical protein